MMLRPSIDSLLDKVNSKYSLVILASKRAHEIDAGAKLTVEQPESVKNVGQALEEIDLGYVINDPQPELKRERIRLEKEANRLQSEQEQRELENRVKEEQNM